MSERFEGLYKAEEIPEGATVRGERVKYHLEHGERLSVAPGRRVVDIPGCAWPAKCPEECQNEAWSGEWFSGLVLLCTGCGLDCT